MGDFDHLRALPGYSRLTREGVDYVEFVFSSPPSRAVGRSSLLSVSGCYASPKFAHLKDYESAGCEKPYVLASIIDDNIVEIFPQPKPIWLLKHDVKGRRRHREYVPDYLEIGRDQFSLIENKPLSELRRLSANTVDWTEREDGSWRFCPAETRATELGLGFRIFCPDSYSTAHLANLQILCRLPTENLLDETPRLLSKVRSLLQKRPRTVLELCETFGGITGAWIYQAILKGHLFGLLDVQLLDKDFLIYATAKEALQNRQWIRNASEPNPIHQGRLSARLAKCSPKELELAFAAQHRFDARRAQNLRYNATDYRDKEKQKQAKEEGAPRLAAFVRRVGDRGGAGPALATELRKEACESINRALEQGIIPKQSKLYGFYQIDKKRRGEPVSRESFRKILNQDLGVEKLALLAGGKRAFHASRPRTGGKQFNPRLAIAGLRMHIDGVYGDVRAKPDEDALYARPIFYPLIDDITGKIHGRGIKVGRPSRLPVAMAHRDCYMRNGYLPAQIYHDWGPEFDNILVPEMVGYFGVGYERRPAGAPRFGGYGEMFNAQFSAFLQSLAGGTYFDKAGRAADGSKKSRKTAELEIPGIIHLADEYMFETWNNTPIGNNNKTPNELDEQSKACFPEAFVYVADDFLARYYTSIPLSSEEFDLRSGYRYGDQRYTSAELIELLVNGKKATAPRLDCMNPSVVYALTDNGPIALHSSDFHRVSGMEISQRISTLRELVTYSTTAMANQMKRNQRKAKQLAEMSKVAARAADADPKEMDAPGHRQQDVYKKVDFSDVDTTVELQRLIYEDVK